MQRRALQVQRWLGWSCPLLHPRLTLPARAPVLQRKRDGEGEQTCGAAQSGGGLPLRTGRGQQAHDAVRAGTLMLVGRAGRGPFAPSRAAVSVESDMRTDRK